MSAQRPTPLSVATNTGEYTRAIVVADLPPGTMRRVVIRGVDVAVYHTDDDEYFATQDTCTHAQASLTEGDLDEYEVECPLHGARFDIQTGDVLSLPAFEPLVTYSVRVEDGAVWVKVDQPPTLP